MICNSRKSFVLTVINDNSDQLTQGLSKQRVEYSSQLLSFLVFFRSSLTWLFLTSHFRLMTLYYGDQTSVKILKFNLWNFNTRKLKIQTLTFQFLNIEILNFENVSFKISISEHWHIKIWKFKLWNFEENDYQFP